MWGGLGHHSGLPLVQTRQLQKGGGTTEGADRTWALTPWEPQVFLPLYGVEVRLLCCFHWDIQGLFYFLEMIPRCNRSPILSLMGCTEDLN